MLSRDLYARVCAPYVKEAERAKREAERAKREFEKAKRAEQAAIRALVAALDADRPPDCAVHMPRADAAAFARAAGAYGGWSPRYLAAILASSPAGEITEALVEQANNAALRENLGPGTPIGAQPASPAPERITRKGEWVTYGSGRSVAAWSPTRGLLIVGWDDEYSSMEPVALSVDVRADAAKSRSAS